MSTVALIILVAALGAMAALVFAPSVRQSGRGGLMNRFGPEYDRAVSRHNGDEKAALWELSERVRHYGNLPVQRLSPEARESYAARWAGLQEQFVDAPAHAVREADRLLGELAVERGYASASHEEQMDAMSVRHAYTVDGYRRLHLMAAQTRGGGEVETERMREALVSARSLFEELVRAQPQDRGLRRRHPSRRPVLPQQSRGGQRPGRIPGQRLGPAR
ncbi:hypothetical protein [Streptomyces coffeae]|uniref:Secreted protein n=1 Tax=Streptomyces coffeae TaxID=621382 RepID=A0ABS1NH01_9ACTN|nr:hypothetical protein [Streptomyces coffeae]MBL1099335.1 hypothetical protein [Streptomyces coffeae]